MSTLYTAQYFKDRSSVIHKGFYNYSKVEYINNKTKVIIICPVHGEFKQRVDNHLRGKGCLQCANNSFKLTYEEFINASNIKHKGFYNYSKVEYVNNKTKITIICPVHGEFKQRAAGHLDGNGCLQCANNSFKLTYEEFINASNIKHDNKYIYPQQEYVNNKTKIIIICPIHGEFKQRVDSHLSSGNGCPKCMNLISKPEVLFLDSLNILLEYRQYRIGRYLVDGYDPITNTVYEFSGDYWHGNPSVFNPNDMNKRCKLTYGELYKKTIKKFDDLIKLGYKVKYIWENDYIKHVKDNTPFILTDHVLVN